MTRPQTAGLFDDLPAEAMRPRGLCGFVLDTGWSDPGWPVGAALTARRSLAPVRAPLSGRW